MSAEIDSQNFFLESQQRVLVILVHIRHPDLEILLHIISRQIKKAELPGHCILLLLGGAVHDLTVNRHLLPAVPLQAVQRSRFDKVLYGSFIDRSRKPLHKIFQGKEGTSVLSFFYQSFDHRPSHAFDSGKSVADTVSVNRKSIIPPVHIRREDRNSHLAAYKDIFRHLTGHFDYGRHQRGHEFHRIIVFQKSGLIGNHRISRRMGFIEGVLGEIDHLIINLIRHFLGNSIGDTSGNSFFLVAVNEVLTLFLHHRCFLLGHGAAHQVASPQCISRQITHDLHNLFLIHDAPVSGLQDRLQLRTVVPDGIRTVLAPDILGNEIHGAGTVKGDSRDHILQALRFQLFHKAFHSRALKLEHAVGAAGSQRVQNFFVVKIYFTDIQTDPSVLLHQMHRVLDHRQRSQAQEIHLQKPQLLQGGHGKLCGDGSVLGAGQGNIFVHGFLADHHAGGVHGRMAGKPFQTPCRIDQPADILLLFIGLLKLRIHLQRPVDGDIQFLWDHLGDHVYLGVGHIQHTAHVTDHSSGRQGTKSNDLCDTVLAVFAHHIVDNLLSPFKTEIHVDIRHGNTFRVQETLKQKIIFHGVQLRDA